MTGEPLVLLHLSDIHFNRKVLNTVHDPDKDLRLQLERDSESMLKTFGRIDAILVTGDIAYAARSDEYRYAEDWLRGLAGRLACPDGRIWVSPGNHDVDWTKLDTEVLKALRAQLVQRNEGEIDEALRFYLLDEEAGPALFRPLGNYNEFAARFDCAIGPLSPFWEKDITLGEELVLRVRGLNSTWVSGKTDKRGQLILGQTHALCPETDGVQYLTLCHHPPEWLLDEDAALDALHGRARILLFGHKHVQRYYQQDQTLRLTAGAVHPERKEKPWEPRYNFLRIQAVTVDSESRLAVQVYERAWTRDLRFGPTFVEGGREARDFELRIGQSRRATRPADVPPPTPVLELIGATDEPSGVQDRPEEQPVHAGKLLAQRFLRLAPYQRTDVAKRLGVFDANEAQLPEVERARRVFRRAQENNLLTRLWEEVARYYPGEAPRNNPFSQGG